MLAAGDRQMLREPTTMLTDYLLGGLTLFWGGRVFRKGRREDQRSLQLWGAAFYSTGAAALTGGTYHGFAELLPAALIGILWKVTVYLTGVGSFFLLAGAAVATIPQPARRWVLWAAAAKLIAYLGWMTAHDEFRYVIYDYAATLLVVLLLAAGDAYQRPGRGGAMVIGGILVSAAAAGAQLSGFTLHTHFNHNDLYHVLQMGAFFLLYRGGLQWRDR